MKKNLFLYTAIISLFYLCESPPPSLDKQIIGKWMHENKEDVFYIKKNKTCEIIENKDLEDEKFHSGVWTVLDEKQVDLVLNGILPVEMQIIQITDEFFECNMVTALLGRKDTTFIKYTRIND